jgi:hypothetical protein
VRPRRRAGSGRIGRHAHRHRRLGQASTTLIVRHRRQRSWPAVHALRGLLCPATGAGSAHLLHTEDEVADVDLVGLLDHERAGDLASVDVGPVRALEVDDDELAVLQDDASVPLGDVALGQDDVVALDAADRDLRLVEIEPALLAALLRDSDREHSAFSRCGDARPTSRRAPPTAFLKVLEPY